MHYIYVAFVLFITPYLRLGAVVVGNIYFLTGIKQIAGFHLALKCSNIALRLKIVTTGLHCIISSNDCIVSQAVFLHATSPKGKNSTWCRNHRVSILHFVIAYRVAIPRGSLTTKM